MRRQLTCLTHTLTMYPGSCSSYLSSKESLLSVSQKIRKLVSLERKEKEEKVKETVLVLQPNAFLFSPISLQAIFN